MMQIFYRIIYSDNINFFLRNINKLLSPLLPQKIKIPPTGVIKIKSPEGRMLNLKLNQTSYLGSVIFWNGGHLKFEYTSIFIKLIKKVNSFFDVGANVGYYSLLAAIENKEINIVSFEPATGPLFFLRENIRINDFENIKVESLALSNKEGTIDFYEIKNKKYKYLEHCLSGESNAGSITTGRNFQINVVKTTTLDNYVKLNNVQNIELIKMDTEGTENLILENSSHVLSVMKPILICETLFNTIEPELEKVMSSFGYEFYNHTEKGLQKVKSIIRAENNGVTNCFFVHPEKYHLIEEFVVKEHV